MSATEKFFNSLVFFVIYSLIAIAIATGCFCIYLCLSAPDSPQQPHLLYDESMAYSIFAFYSFLAVPFLWIVARCLTWVNRKISNLEAASAPQQTTAALHSSAA